MYCNAVKKPVPAYVIPMHMRCQHSNRQCCQTINYALYV